jgi:CheY-like chemotaxis protein
MSTYLISPFHFPTSIVLVDDHSIFLEHLSLNFGQRLAYHLFNNPDHALQFLNREIVGLTTDQHNLLSIYSQRQDFNEKDHVVNLKLDSIYRKVYDKNRFSHVSVVVADYNMPQMDGLTFCNAIQNKNIKKILLTGKADETIAVKALNEKTIDFFIKKQNPQTIPILLTAVQELQKNYFETIENLLVDALAVGAYKFLKDPELSRYFGKIHQDLKIVEHYLVNSPDRILMLNHKAKAYSFLVYTKSALEAQCQVAKAQDAPPALIQALESGDYVPYFYRNSGYYDPGYTEWTQHIHSAIRINGQEPYWCAIVEETHFLDCAHIFSQADYISALDSVKFTDGK